MPSWTQICDQSQLADVIRSHWQPVRFPRKAQLWYENQTPNCGLFLDGGQLILESLKSVKRLEGTLVIGLPEILEFKPSRFTATLEPESYVSLFDRADFIRKLSGSPELKDLLGLFRKTS